MNRAHPGAGIRLVVTAITALAAWTVGCEPPSKEIVARIGDETLTVTDVNAYLAVNLDEDWDQEALSDEERDLVHSRLFDAFLEERLLLHEADRQGVRVDDDEVDAFLAAGAGPDPAVDPESDDAADEAPAAPEPIDPGRRIVARRSLRIQRLIDRAVPDAGDVDPAEVDDWLRQSRGAEDGPDAGQVVLRSLLMPSTESARRTYGEIRRGRMTFDEAVALYEPTPGQAAPSDLPESGLPQAVRDAIEGLGERRTSEPVELNGDVFLFHVVRRGPEAGDLDAARARARRELLEHRYVRAGRRLLERLRSELDVEIYPEHLPFRYVPDPGES